MRIDLIKYPQVSWTGGDIPPVGFYHKKGNQVYRAIVKFYFQQSLATCGGLDLWKCAGTSAMERARIFWHHAKLDAWRAMNH